MFNFLHLLIIAIVLVLSMKEKMLKILITDLRCSLVSDRSSFPSNPSSSSQFLWVSQATATFLPIIILVIILMIIVILVDVVVIINLSGSAVRLIVWTGIGYGYRIRVAGPNVELK